MQKLKSQRLGLFYADEKKVKWHHIGLSPVERQWILDFLKYIRDTEEIEFCDECEVEQGRKN